MRYVLRICSKRNATERALEGRVQGAGVQHRVHTTWANAIVYAWIGEPSPDARNPMRDDGFSETDGEMEIID